MSPCRRELKSEFFADPLCRCLHCWALVKFTFPVNVLKCVTSFVNSSFSLRCLQSRWPSLQECVIDRAVRGWLRFPTLSQTVNLSCMLCAFLVWVFLVCFFLFPQVKLAESQDTWLSSAEPGQSASIGPDYRASLVGQMQELREKSHVTLQSHSLLQRQNSICHTVKTRRFYLTIWGEKVPSLWLTEVFS